MCPMRRRPPPARADANHGGHPMSKRAALYWLWSPSRGDYAIGVWVIAETKHAYRVRGPLPELREHKSTLVKKERITFFPPGLFGAPSND